MPNNMKICNQCKSQFEITDDDRKFYNRMQVPEPTLCFECRMKRKLAYRNDRSLYKTESTLTGKPIISMYDPENKFVVYEQSEWWGDKWDPLDYGRDFDFKRSFFEQFAELQKTVPRFNLFNMDSENCEYVNYAPHCKNSYLIFGSWFNQDCLYGQTFSECKNSMDSLFLEKSELCYENIDCDLSYGSCFCQNCSSATECYFCYDCKNVKNCIGCWNLRNKEYYVLNKPVPKEKFNEIKNSFKSFKTVEDSKRHFWDMIKKNAIHKYYTGQNNENSTGDLLFNCKNVKNCFSAYRCQDLAYCNRLMDQKDTYDFEGGGKGELCYESMSNDFSFNSISCTTCEHMTNSHYSDLCFNCEECLGCIGLRYKKYCLFNKQYSKEEYKVLSEKVINHMKKLGEWGEFFPASLSPFGYNETMANEYFPLSKEEAIKQGYRWKDEVMKNPQMQTIKLPDSISDITDQILDEVLLCGLCNKNYKIVSKELKFYKQIGLPVPRICPDCRHKERMGKRNPRKLFNRKCDNCGTDIKTSYSPERPEKVYCEKCYLKTVY